MDFSHSPGGEILVDDVPGLEVPHARRHLPAHLHQPHVQHGLSGLVAIEAPEEGAEVALAGVLQDGGCGATETC